MAGSETPLGIVPGGRGNDLARVLGIPDDPLAAVAVLAAGESRRIDVGEANGKRFLGIVSVGFDSECNRLANEVTIIRSNLVYVYSLFRTLLAWRPARFTIRSESRADSSQRLLDLRRQQQHFWRWHADRARSEAGRRASRRDHGRRGRQAALRG